jgi:hypothetical protein
MDLLQIICTTSHKQLDFVRLVRATKAPTPVTWPRRQRAFGLQTPLRALTEAMLDAMPSVLYCIVDLIPSERMPLDMLIRSDRVL